MCERKTLACKFGGNELRNSFNCLHTYLLFDSIAILIADNLHCPPKPVIQTHYFSLTKNKLTSNTYEQLLIAFRFDILIQIISFIIVKLVTKQCQCFGHIPIHTVSRLNLHFGIVATMLVIFKYIVQSYSTCSTTMTLSYTRQCRPEQCRTYETLRESINNSSEVLKVHLYEVELQNIFIAL